MPIQTNLIERTAIFNLNNVPSVMLHLATAMNLNNNMGSGPQAAGIFPKKDRAA